MVSALYVLRIERSGFDPWPESFRQDTSETFLSHYRSRQGNLYDHCVAEQSTKC